MSRFQVDSNEKSRMASLKKNAQEKRLDSLHWSNISKKHGNTIMETRIDYFDFDFRGGLS